jgi:hypothetical protein
VEQVQLRDIDWFLFPLDADQRFAAMFAAYLDESSDEKMERVFAISVLLGRSEAWVKFEHKWNALLDEYGLEYYRSTEAEHARGQFDKPPFRTEPNSLTFEQNEMLRQVRDRFLDVATGNDRAGIVLGVDMRVFQAIACTPEILDKFGNTPYYVCAHFAMIKAVKMIQDELRSKELVAFISDKQDQFSSTMLRVHDDLIAKNPNVGKQFGSLAFQDKKAFKPLQAADSLVYEGRRYIEADLFNSGSLERKELQKWKESHTLAFVGTLGRETLEAFLAGQGSINENKTK